MWPDVAAPWRNVDRWPDGAARLVLVLVLFVVALAFHSNYEFLVRIITFWARARWATPPDIWGTLTDFSFSSIFWEQWTQIATLGIRSHLPVPPSSLFDAAGKWHRP